MPRKGNNGNDLEALFRLLFDFYQCFGDNGVISSGNTGFI